MCRSLFGNRGFRQIYEKSMAWLAFACIAAPPFGLLCGLTGRIDAWRGLLMPLFACLVSTVLLVLRPIKGALMLLLGAVISFGGALLFSAAGMWGLLAAVPCALMTLVMLSKRSAAPGREWSGAVWAVGLASAPVCMFLERALPFRGDPPHRMLLTLCFLLYLLLFLLHANRDTLEASSHASLTGRKVPLAVRLQNKAAVFVLFLCGAAAAFFPQIADALRTLRDWVLHAFGTVLDFLSALLPTPSPSGESAGAGGGGPLGGLEASEPSPFWLFLEKALAVLALAAAAVLVFFGLRFLFRKAVVLWKALKKTLLQMAIGASEDYVDEVTSTRENAKEQERIFRERGRPGRDPRPKGGREEVRWLYRQFLRRHPERRGLTCREAMKEEKGPEEFADLYEKARYSQHPIQEDQLNRVRSGFKSAGL